MGSKFLAMLFLAATLMACGADTADKTGDPSDVSTGSCRYEYECDGTGCVGTGSGCTSGDELETESISDQATCEAFADEKAAAKNASVTTATWDAEGDC